MPTYAANTDVSTDRSRAEIERTLERYGADGFMYGRDGQHAVIMFRVHGRMIRFILDLPDKDDPAYQKKGINQYRSRQATPDEAYEQWDKACRQKWRALALVIKAKLEAVESEIVSFEEEFLAHTVLPDGQTVGQWMLPQVERAYLTGNMPTLLPQLTAGDR
jgi:tRNA-dihydrouridine synthase